MLTAVCLMVYYSSMPIISGRAAESLGLVEAELGYLGGAFAAGVTIASFASILSVVWLQYLGSPIAFMFASAPWLLGLITFVIVVRASLCAGRK